MGHADVVRLLLESEFVDPGARDSDPVKISCKAGYADVVRSLQSGRVNLAANNAIIAAPRKGESEIIALGNMDPTVYNNACVRHSSERADSCLVRLLLASRSVDPAAFNNNLFKQTAKNGHFDVVLESGKVWGKLDPTANENYSLRIGSQKEHTEVVKLRHDSGNVDPAAANNQAIQLACCYGHTGVVEILLASGRVDPAANNNYSIRIASKRGYTKVVKLLLESGKVDPDANAMEAIRNAKHKEIVQLLLRSKNKPSNICTRWMLEIGYLICIVFLL
ncbi:hypothetical protein BDR26DRAFT_864559 [Obelidium mucronatum]|nr:hypothetical protein BDR26DRAFT_864559 [Obelidium mucronatum]